MLKKRTYQISLDKVRIGQLLEIDYTGGSSKGTSKILVVGQTTDKLHAIKLKNNFEESDVIKLTTYLRNMIGDLSWYDERVVIDGNPITDYMMSSGYVDDRPYRTYKKTSINKQSIVMIGQEVEWVNTIRLSIGNSILYGMSHGSYVYVNNHDLNQLALDVITRGYKTYFEGPERHEEPTTDLLNYLVGDGRYTAESWEPELGKEEAVLELFGGSAEGLVDAVVNIMGERGIDFGKSLGELLSLTSGKPEGSITSFGRHKVSETDIRKMLSGAVRMGLDIRPLDVIIEDVDQLGTVLTPFFEQTQKYAFGEDYRSPRKAQSSEERDWLGEFVPRSELEELQEYVNLKRDENLVRLMKTQPGVYFVGEGHIRLVKQLL